MKYLCMLYYDIDKFEALSQAEKEAIGPLCKPYDKQLRATGKVYAVGTLNDPSNWMSIRPHGGESVVTKGKYFSSSEQAGAFMIIDANSLDEAVKIASIHPAAHLGENIGWGVEVRACESFD